MLAAGAGCAALAAPLPSPAVLGEPSVPLFKWGQ